MNRLGQMKRAIGAWLGVALLAASNTPLTAQVTVLESAGLGEVVRQGQGPIDVIIIPCMSCRWSSFDDFMDRNQDRYTMYAVTLTGFGGSPTPDLSMNGPEPVWQNHAVNSLSDLIDREGLEDVVVIGHSFGSRIGLLLSSKRSEKVRAFINLDGRLNSDRSWFPDDPEARQSAADDIVVQNLETFRDPEQWRLFNSSSRANPARRALYHGMFMATPHPVLLQYWRENVILDVNPALASLTVPTLDVKAISINVVDPEAARSTYLNTLERNDAPASVHTVFLPETSHFVMEQRPLLIDQMIDDFIGGESVIDLVPDSEEDIARRYVRDLRSLWAADASAETLDRFMSAFAEDVTYEHESRGVSLSGKDTLRPLYQARLGETRNPSVDLQGVISSPGSVVLELAVRMDGVEAGQWSTVFRRQVTILEFKDGQIVRITDHW